MKTKSKKTALLMSFTSLLICFAMLVGSTFAWFTDTASTGVNKIVSGNLKVDIIGANSDSHIETLNFTKAGTTDDDATQEILWEPGCRYLTEGFRIANKGNLALKWKAQVNKDSITDGKVEGSTIAKDGMSLLNVIDFYVVTKAADGTETEVAIEDFIGNLGKDAKSEVYYIKGVMQTTAGNDYQDLTLEGITITVYATQDTVENDSFDNQYDRFAAYAPSGKSYIVTTHEEAKRAFAAGGSIIINKYLEGDGPDRASALRDAERIAVENVVGTYIDSQTMVSQGQVALDDIYAKATGFVRNTNVISEGTTSDGYTVKASIDVNTDGNSALISQLTAIRRLNDPRIAVVVLNRGQRDEISETAINERLIDMGFSHVVDANLVASLQDARLLEHIYNGGTSIHSVGSNFGVDFLVLGKTATDSRQIEIPDFKGGYKNTRLTSGKAEMTAKIIRFDTGDIVGTFAVEASGIENGSGYAEKKAVKALAVQAAEKVEEKFKKVGANVNISVQVIVKAWDYQRVEDVAAALRGVPGINNVYIREHNGEQAILECDSTQSAQTIAAILRKNRQVGIFVDGISGSTITVLAR